MSSLFAAPAITKASSIVSTAVDHQSSLVEQQNLNLAVAQLAPAWTPLPMGPYPPGDDATGFPRSGDSSLVVSSSSVSKEQLSEPARAYQGLVDQALARRPKLSPLFWVGLACLGAGIYLAKK